MNLLSVENISKSYGEKILFEDLSLGIGDGDKIGLIGVNGTGKSTLLKIIAGIDSVDSGEIIKSNGMRVEYLSQSVNFDKEDTVLNQVFKGSSKVMSALREYERALDKLNKDPNNDEFQKKIISLSQQVDALGGWNLESEAKSILTRLGIYNFEAKVGDLSGGQRKRIALAAALIQPCDLLILDEPTNHIDNDTISWLEEYLNKRKGSVLMITHDRYFLDRVTNRILELDGGKLYSYDGNYSVFLEKKIERQEIMESSEKKRQNLLRKELAWIKRGAKARSTKQKARIDRFEKLKEDKIDINTDKIEMSTGSTRLGKKVIILDKVSKSFEDFKIIDDFNYIVCPDDRIGIIGNNGYGKSTLLNIFSGRLKPDSGNVDIGETVKIGYFAQENNHMDESMRVIDYIKESGEFLRSEDGELISASKMLERFLFPSQVQYTPIGKLSGGERRRLYLLKVLMEAPNVLFLDEPTNDLDIETLTILEDYLDNFSGVVITVSHDRYFLDRIAKKIIAFEGKGKIEQYTGNYSDYYSKFINRKVEASDNKNIKKDKIVKEEKKKDKPLKFTFKEQKEYEEIDEKIQSAEEEIEEINKQVNQCGSDYAKLKDLLPKQKEAEEKLEYLTERWVYLQELAEKIEENKNNK